MPPQNYRKRFAGIKLLMVSLAIFIGACSAPMPDMDLTPEVNGLFVAIGEGDIDKAMSYYSDDFYKSFPKEYWRERLEKFNQHMGTMESYRIRSKQSDTRFSGKFFVFQLETIHKDNKKAKHIVTFILPVDGGPVKMVGHKITAKGFSN